MIDYHSQLSVILQGLGLSEHIFPVNHLGVVVCPISDSRDDSASEFSLLCFCWLTLLYLLPTLSDAEGSASLRPNSKVG